MCHPIYRQKLATLRFHEPRADPRQEKETLSAVLTQTLPCTSFVPFDCYAVAGSKVVWRNPDANVYTPVDAYKYCAPMYQEATEHYVGHPKTYLAERYGGIGLSGNGGGARCGIYDGVQIKGVGRTPVAGRDTESSYSNGGASLQEGIREAIWGEICHIALPYGGARVYGLIRTGTMCSSDATRSNADCQRTLILRQAVLRPAHFMRAPYFRPSAEFETTYVSDTVRTKRAVRSIGAAFEHSLGLSSGSTSQCVSEGMTEMVKRIAYQTSVANAKRIMHGALSDSNVCIDGGWVDYGTATTLSDYGSVIAGARTPDLWHQHYPLYQMISNLRFYLSKWLPHEISKAIPQADNLIGIFNKQLNHCLDREYVKLIGIPFAVCPDLLGSRVVTQVGQCFRSIIKTGNEEPFKLREMPDTMGRYSLNDLLRGVCTCGTKGEMESAIQQQLADPCLRRTFCGIVWDVRQMFLNSVPTECRVFTALCSMLTALRLNSPFNRMYRPNLNRSINDVIQQHQSINSLIATLTHEAETYVCSSNMDAFELAPLMDDPSHVSHVFSREICQLDEMGNIIYRLRKSILSSAQKDMAMAYAKKLFTRI